MTTLVLMIIAFLGGAASASAWHRSRAKSIAEASADLERAVIRAAFQCGGRITALDVRPPRDTTLAEVEAQLRRMHVAGHCDNELSPDGSPIYIFRAFDEEPVRVHRLESEILQMARRHEGLVDVSKIASETELSYVEARRKLDEMSEQGICEPTENPDTYRFFPSRGRLTE